MKAVAFNGSPREKGNTYTMLRQVCERLEQASIDTELVQIGGKLIKGCRACGTCKKLQNKCCIMDDDPANSALQKMIDADIILLGSPTYFAALTPEMKALIDRTGYVSRANGGLLKRKIGASIAAVRRAGALNVFQAINNFFLINEMIIPGSSYWNLSIARDPGDFLKDEEGLQTMGDLGDNIVWLAERLQ